ncbi:DUF5666 domain-containing protein [uncultured Desulfosarcina sp.]|uniref:DUF5666 domain-containing protein n=1 Tax=uncultured Desulfosarcina sp. TaxID=218289 RepID=UPI0029C6DFE2|nr:DUF5666 domain-containing protein [uncultured Desulfosarcina sp.]
MNLTRKRTRWAKALLILAGCLIIGCGGGVGDLASSGGGIGGSGVNGGGTGGTGISSGSVTAIGSVHVNGVRYDTGDAEIFVEGQSVGFGDEEVRNNLKVGMIVRVEGELEDSENGIAEKVYFNDDLRGPVKVGSFQWIDPETAQLVVLGKTVIINELTNVVGLDIEDSLEGQWIQVSGFEDAQGRIQATFVTGSYPGDRANLKGTITSVSPDWITINGITPVYSAGATLVGLDQLVEGQLVEVTGILSGFPFIYIHADTIEKVDLLGTTDIDSIELEGIITEKTSEEEFRLNGVPVVLNDQTLYTGGDADDIDEDVQVEAEGQLINGTLHAERIVFLSFAKVEADFSAIDRDLSLITLHGLSDITIRYDQNTMITGAVTTIDEIDETLHVKTIGMELPSSDPASMLAIHIITLDPLSNKVILQGALETVPPADRSFITLLGHQIDISGVSDDGFESPDGTGYSNFYNFTEAGDIVSAKGTRSGETITWQSISVE